MENVIILGSGPAGLTAALYAARAQLSPLVIAGPDVGGQVAVTYTVENYPGFPDAVGGPELVELMRRQAERFGARIEYDSASAVKLAKTPFHVITDGGSEYETRTLIIATGAYPRKLEVPGEQELTGRGVSYCATCDGYFFRDKEVMVMGGGDSALEEGLFLTRFASKVHIIHRRDQLRAGPVLQERARASEKIDFVLNTGIEEILGEDQVQGVRLRDLQTGKETVRPTDGVFIYVGHIPNTQMFRGELEMDERGYLITYDFTRTSVPGVFAAGEVADPVYRQVVTSAGMGCAAAMDAEKYLAAQRH